MYRDETKNLTDSVVDWSEEEFNVEATQIMVGVQTLDFEFSNLYFETSRFFRKDICFLINNKIVTNNEGQVINIRDLALSFYGYDVSFLSTMYGIAYVYLTYKESEDSSSSEIIADGVYRLTYTGFSGFLITDVLKRETFMDNSILNGFIAFKILKIDTEELVTSLALL